MKKALFTVSISLLIFIGRAQGFDSPAINFGLPNGGSSTNIDDYSYYAISNYLPESIDANGSQLWYVMDMNGDGKSDILVYREKEAGNYRVPGPIGSRYWKVYLNNGSGFEINPTYWTLPTGGNITATENNSYYDVFSNYSDNTEVTGSQFWKVMDMNGDTKPDLLVYSEKEAGTYRVPGTTGNRYWKVYLNNGSGFDINPINWTLPTGGKSTTTEDKSYYNIFNNYVENTEVIGSQLWYLIDINGDGKSDLLVYSEKVASGFAVPGTTGSHYWKVFVNNGSGFDATPLNWTLPIGGRITSTDNNSYYNIGNDFNDGTEINGSQMWNVLDINGDNNLDLLVYQEKQSGTFAVPGTQGNRYWKVYLNNSSGFNTSPINWALPAGGNITAAGNNSFYKINRNFADSGDLAGSQMWYLMDINGDSAQDLVVLQEKQGSNYAVFGSSGNKYWKVFYNNNTSFNAAAANWSLPAGGNITALANNSYYDINHDFPDAADSNGSQLWYVMDMNGDQKSDLLVVREKISGSYTVPGTTNNRYWKVYLNNSSPLSTIDNAFSDNQITIYPNPLMDFSTITFNEKQENTTLNIFDLTGKKVMTDTCTGNDYILKRGNLQPGLYILQLIDTSKKITIKKLVVQ